MGLYTGDEDFIEQIYQFEETDLVLAGTDNRPLKELADRTMWLKANLGRIVRYEDVEQITAVHNPVISSILAHKLIKITATDNLLVSLDPVASFAPGQVICISSKCVPFKAITIKCNGVEIIEDGSQTRNVIHMCDHERLWLVAAADHFEISLSKRNFWTAGDSFMSRKQQPNTIILQGQEVSRIDFPRVFKTILTLTNGEEVVDEAVWQGSIYYKGCFSLGNGITTFRFPDERAMFDRALDLGRGIDYNRAHNYPGGFEADSIIYHNHKTNLSPNANSAAGFGKVTTGGDSPEGVFPPFVSTGPLDAFGVEIGSNETTPKSLGKLPLMKY